MKKVLSVLAISSLFGLSVLTGCGSNSSATPAPSKDEKLVEVRISPNDTQALSANKKLTLATSADYPPYEFHDTSSGKNEIVGFDIDIANYIAKDLGFQVDVKEMDFNGLIPALQSKQADFVMAGMAPKPDRLQNADFSDIYYEAKNTIVSKKGRTLTKLEDLVGKKVGVQLGTVQEGETKKMQGVNVVSLNKIPDIIQEIKSNHLDAAIIEDTVSKGYQESVQNIEFHTIPNTESTGSAVAFPKGSNLIGDFNKEIKKMKDNGELDNLIKKWFEKK